MDYHIFLNGKECGIAAGIAIVILSVFLILLIPASIIRMTWGMAPGLPPIDTQTFLWESRFRSFANVPALKSKRTTQLSRSNSCLFNSAV